MQWKLDCLRTAVPSKKQLKKILRRRRAWKTSEPTAWDVLTLLREKPDTTVVTCTRGACARVRVLGTHGGCELPHRQHEEDTCSPVHIVADLLVHCKGFAGPGRALGEEHASVSRRGHCIFVVFIRDCLAGGHGRVHPLLYLSLQALLGVCQPRMGASCVCRPRVSILMPLYLHFVAFCPFL